MITTARITHENTNNKGEETTMMEGRASAKSNKKHRKTRTKAENKEQTAVEYHGLLNQGATCYLNSVLQVLFMTKDFREAVGRHSRENPDTECTDPQLNTLFDHLEQHTTCTNKITKKLGIDNVKEQRDAAEYYEKILSLTSPDASQIFHGLSTHKTICSTCQTETGIDEAFWHLPLALMDSYSEHYSVLDGIEDYFRASEFIEENQMYCEQCDAKSDATSKYVMKHHPEVLMLLLKRFEFDYRYMTYVKINRSVDVPCKLQIPENQTYELYAVVDHSGGLRGGHYTATIKANEKWYNFNDARVTLCIYQKFQVNNLKQSSTAYLLFYRKINARAANTCTQDTTEESRAEGFTPAPIDITDQHKDNLMKKKRERKMEGDEQAEKKMKPLKKYSERDAEHLDSERLDEVRQNLNKDLGGTQQVEQDYDLKPVSVAEEVDRKKMEIDAEVNKEGNTGSKTGQLLMNHDLYSQKRSDSGRVGDSQQDITRNNQRCGQESSSRCKRPEQQREERGDDKDAQRRVTSLRQQQFGWDADYQDSEGLDDVRQNLKKNLVGTQQVGKDYDLKLVSLDKEGDGKNVEINVETDKERKSGSDDDLGSQQDITRHDQRCRQESSSRCKRPEQQREERGDEKDAQRREASPRHEYCGQSVEDQNKGSKQRDSARHTGYKDVGMERQTKEQEKKRAEHIQNRVESSLRRAGSAGSRRATENQEVSRVEKMNHPRNEFTKGRVEGTPRSKTSRPCFVSTDDKITDSVQSSSDKSYIPQKEPHKLNQVDHNEGNVERKSGPKTDENAILSGSVHSLQLSESGLQEPQEQTNKRATRNAQVEAAEMTRALEKRGEKKTRKLWQKNKQKAKEKKERKKRKEKQKTPGCFCFRLRKNAVQTSESED